jgi:NAD(P)-dependent dehydrogenase (short-subunit alcohol dehydrogenase family)
MKSILITGCNRGIGFGLVKYLTEQAISPQYLFATCRNPAKAEVCFVHLTSLLTRKNGRHSIFHFMQMKVSPLHTRQKYRHNGHN